METIIRRVETLLAARIGTGRASLVAEFLRFGTVGGVGFLVDTATVYALKSWLGLYGAGLAAYLTAATVTWAGNRLWTFRGRGAGRAHHQWAAFLAANSVGFVLNRGTYALLIAFIPFVAAWPVLAVAGGTAAGMFINFGLSRKLVFRQPRPPQ